MEKNHSSTKLGSIKDWAEEDRPREKLLLKGRHSLTDAELLAILISTGISGMSALDLAKLLLSKANNSLNELAKFSVEEIKKAAKGIGDAKAITIVSALELGRRRKAEEVSKKTKITSSEDVYHCIQPYLTDLRHEEFWVLMLNRANEVIKTVSISKGGVSGTVADPKIIFQQALESLASAIILIHNHPSGNKQPSQADIKLTQQAKEGGKFLEIPVLDHLIYTEDGYYSFADEGRL
jgi:DNA repair protein RadC